MDIDCEYSLEPHRRGGSNGNPQSMFQMQEIYHVYPSVSTPV